MVCPMGTMGTMGTVLALGVHIKLPKEVAVPLAIVGAVIFGLVLYAALLGSLVTAQPTPEKRRNRWLVGGILFVGFGAWYGWSTLQGTLTTNNLALAGLMGFGMTVGGYVIASGAAPLAGALCLFATAAALIARPLVKPFEWTYENGAGVVERGTFGLDSETHYYYLVPGILAVILGAALVMVAIARRKKGLA